MDFLDAVRACLNKYGTFVGRARRSEYWFFVVFGYLAGQATLPLSFLVGHYGGLLTLISLGLFLPGVAVGMRRLHDTNRSGWWLFLNFVPIAGQIVLTIWMFERGTAGANRFGPDPAPEMTAGDAPSQGNALAPV